MLSQRGEEALHYHSLFSLLFLCISPWGGKTWGGGSPAALEPMRFGVEEGHMIISPREKGRGKKRGEGRCKGFDCNIKGKVKGLG